MDKELAAIVVLLGGLIGTLFGTMIYADIAKKDCTIKLAGKYTATEIVLLCK